MTDNSQAILDRLTEIRDLLQILAEPQIAERDRQRRDQLRKLTQRSQKQQQAVKLMDGSRSQTDIAKLAGLDKSQVSKLTKAMREQSLLTEEARKPSLTIPLPPDFFEQEGGC